MFGYLMMDGGYPKAGESAADYNGTSSYANRGSALTGAANGKKGTVSVWVRIDGNDGNPIVIFEISDPTIFSIRRTNANIFQISGLNSLPTTILVLNTVGTFTAGASWINVLASWDLATAGARHLYINDSSDLSVVTFTDDTIDYNNSDVFVGARENATKRYWDGCISELYINQADYLDLSVTANRRKFIDANGNPVDLGIKGETPTGNQPIIYAPDGNPSSNKGSGGDFTANNISACSNTPA